MPKEVTIRTYPPIARKFFKVAFSVSLGGLIILYAPKNIKAALKQVFRNNKSILDVSHVTTTGTRVGLPIATISILESVLRVKIRKRSAIGDSAFCFGCTWVFPT
ncbi:hypothetical protein BCR34DRAFT_582625 [Clohesyomyces aquaticus]|uniref:Uncharacterized protein n=1 Tax=Clohesyomyces aquaticus TaxID=1231657 RepID=A0A1Y2A9T3_9PLEO|nr:hypothetical protein BCR34DRAFT_582625 [Clohesyomyces aquaticus]